MGSDPDEFLARPIQVHTAVANQTADRVRRQRMRSFLSPPAVVESLLDVLRRVLGLFGASESIAHPQPDHPRDPVVRDTEAFVGLAVVGIVFVLLMRRSMSGRR